MKSGMTGLPRLMLIWVLMVVCGCSLTAPSEGGAAAFEGPPVIRIASPLPNQTFLAGATVVIQARIENAGPDMARVSVLLDDAVVGEQLNPNEIGAAEFSVKIDWPTSIPGQYAIAVDAARGDGAVTRETVTVTVIGQTDSGAAVSGESADEAASEAVPEPPTADAPSPTLDSLAARVITASNLRTGPSTRFDPPLDNIAANRDVEIVAVNPDGDWYKIRYDGGEAWIYAGSVSATRDVAGLPLDSGPSPPANPVNLTVGGIAIQPHPLVCGEPAQIEVTVHNEGTAAAAPGGWIEIEAMLKSTSEVMASAGAVFPAIPAGGSFTASANLTVDIHYNETQSIRITVDTPNQVDESNEDDNVRYDEYVLQQGGCP